MTQNYVYIFLFCSEGKWEEIKEHLTGILEIYSIGLDK